MKLKKPIVFFFGILVGMVYSFMFVTIGDISMQDIFHSWGWENGWELLRMMLGIPFLVIIGFMPFLLISWLYEKFIER